MHFSCPQCERALWARAPVTEQVEEVGHAYAAAVEVAGRAVLVPLAYQTQEVDAAHVTVVIAAAIRRTRRGAKGPPSAG